VVSPGTEGAAPKLLRGTRLKTRVALVCLLVLSLGILLAPGRPPEKPPEERAAPILETQIERAEPARVFRGVQDMGRSVIRHSVAVVTPQEPAFPATFPDFSPDREEGESAPSVGLLVSDLEVLTHGAALQWRAEAVLQLINGRTVLGRVAAFEPETGLVLVTLPDPTVQAPARLAMTPATPGELVVSAARSRGVEVVAPAFIASANGDHYSIAGGSGFLGPGTPLFALNGEAVAVAVGPTQPSVAHAAAPALERLRERIARGRPLPATVGAYFQEMTPALAGALGDTGALVCDVRAGAPADRAGLRPGDVVVEVGASPVASAREAALAIAALASGQPASVLVRRGSRTRTLSLEPEPALANSEHVAPPPAASAPAARRLFSAEQLARAGIPAQARILSVGGQPARGERLPARAGRAPWLVQVQDGTRRYLALVEAAS
jgi:S1-C subfamily serine protease